MNVEKIEAITLANKDAIEYLKKVCEEQYCAAVQKTTYLGGGSFGSAYKVDVNGESIVIKFLRAKDMLGKEIFDLKLLSSCCTVPIPKVLFERKADDIVPIDCYGMQVINGTSAFNIGKLLFLSKTKREKFAETVTTALHDIHCSTNEKFGDTQNPDCESWIEFYRPFAKAIYDKAEELFSQGELPKKVVLSMRAAWEKFDIIFSEAVDKACLIHGDLNIANIMVDKSYNVAGFIDPLNSMYADREYDLFQFDNIGGKRFYLRKVYTEKYGASKNCDIKCAFYGLWNEVYCYIKAGTLFWTIMNPLVKNMNKQLSKLN